MNESQIGYKLLELLKELEIHDFNSWKWYKEEMVNQDQKKIDLASILEAILDEYYKE